MSSQAAITRARDACGPSCLWKASHRLECTYNIDFNGERPIICLRGDMDQITSARYPQYASWDVRARSFVAQTNATTRAPLISWTNSLICKAELAAAGFFRYHVMVANQQVSWDACCCFQCGLVLSDWRAGDIPLWQHLRYATHCNFALLAYINGQLARCTESLPPYTSLSLYDLQRITVVARDATSVGVAPAVPPQQYHRETSFFCYRTPDGRRLRFEGAVLSALYRDLARCGFYYVGPNDEVCCFACNIVLSNWTSRHRPDIVHALFSPLCPFIRGIPCGNEPLHRQLPPPQARTTTAAMDYTDPLIRRQTFGSWWLGAEMADAGFYYIADCDMIQCYMCHGTITRPHREHGELTPEQIHSFWFPNCSLTRLYEKNRTLAVTNEPNV